MINFFANILGTLINFIYEIVKDYGLSIIIFTIIVKVLTFFMTLKQKQDSLKTSKVQAQVEELKKKYKNDTLTLNQKTIELYKEEKISPFSSCLFFIIQIILLFAMLSVVSYPLTYIKKTPKEKINNYASILQSKNEDISKNKESENNSKNNEIELQEQNDSNKENGENKEINKNITENVVSNKKIDPKTARMKEIDIIKQFGPKDKDVNLNMSFLGLDLTIIPKNEFNHLKENFSFKNLIPFILPILYVALSIVTSLISLKDMEKLTKVKNSNKENEENKNDDSFTGTMTEFNKNMIYVTPLLMFTVTLVSPLALALYWFMTAFLSIIEVKLIDYILKKEEESNKNKLEAGK